MKTEYRNTLVALQQLQEQPLSEPSKTAETLAAAEQISNLRKADVVRTDYVDYANKDSGLGIALGGERGERFAAVKRGRETALIQQALSDAKKLLAQKGSPDSLSKAVEKLPNSGLDVLKVIFETDLDLDTRASLGEKLQLSGDEVRQLMKVFYELGEPRAEAMSAHHKAQNEEVAALITDTASQIADAVQRRLADGTLDFAAYDRLVDFAKRIPSEIDLDNKDPRGLGVIASFLEYRKDPASKPLLAMNRGIEILLSAIKKDLGPRVGDSYSAWGGQQPPAVPVGFEWKLKTMPNPEDILQESIYELVAKKNAEAAS